MKKHVFPKSILLLISLLICAALYWNGNYVVYILSYIFCFVFLFCYAVLSKSGIAEKLAQTILYALIMTAQILFAVLVIRIPGEEQSTFELYRFVGAVLLFIPFLVRQIFFGRQSV